MAVLDWFAAVHAVNVVVNILHRAGAEEADSGDDVIELCRLHLHQHPSHALPFDLEDTHHVSSRQQIVDTPIAGGNNVQVQVHAVPLADQFTGAAHNGQGGEAQEVNLE